MPNGRFNKKDSRARTNIHFDDKQIVELWSNGFSDEARNVNDDTVGPVAQIVGTE